MKNFILFHLFLVLVLFNLPAARASSTVPQTLAQHADLADAICRGTVIESASYRSAADHGIYTRTLVRVNETLKGKFPAVVTLTHRGGALSNEGEANGFSPTLNLGEERVFFLSQRTDGTLYATLGDASAVKLSHPTIALAGRATFTAAGENLLQTLRQQFPQPSAVGRDVTTQAGSPDGALTRASTGGGSSGVIGLLVDGSNIAPRFTAPDRGEPIPYYIDAQALPTGMTLAQATNAVANALQAWANVTSLKFAFAGLTNFGQAAINVPMDDGALRIQLHDLFNSISGSTTLGLGGRSYSFDTGTFPAGGTGGRVGTNEFHITTRGYLMLKHTSTVMQTLATFEEVLTHEIGHSLGMAHSSVNPSEADPVLRDSVMYYTAHADGRGARLGSYDPPIIQQSHPLNNTPPYAYDRVIYAVTSFQPLANPQVNQVEMKGYDLQGGALTAALCNPTTINGSFSLSGTTLTYTPSGAFSDSGAIDPATSSYYDSTFVRFSDGTNMSPPVLVRVLQFLLCSKPNNAPDGLPDSWRTQYFGSINPVAGTSGANDDPDHDGLTNLQEFLLGTDPNSANSALRITAFSPSALQFTARPYTLYEIETATVFTNWTRLRNPLLPTSPNTAAALNLPATNFQFLRLKRVP